MARLQILELPEGADDDRPPFVLVVDQYEPSGRVLTHDEGEAHRAWWRHLADEAGAQGVLVFSETIELPANEVPIDPDGSPLKFRVEPDFEDFREQVQEEIRKAQAELSGVPQRRT